MGQAGGHAPEGRKLLGLAELFLGVEHRLIESSILDGYRRLRCQRQQQLHLFRAEPPRLYGIHRDQAEKSDAGFQWDTQQGAPPFLKGELCIGRMRVVLEIQDGEWRAAADNIPKDTSGQVERRVLQPRLAPT